MKRYLRWTIGMTALVIAVGLALAGLPYIFNGPDIFRGSDPVMPNQSAGLCYTSIAPIEFLPDQTEIDSEGRALLDRLCQCLRDNPDQNLLLVGCSRPTEAHGQALAAHRAHAVKRYLIEGPCALDGERLSDHGMISGAPATDGKVEFRLRK